RVATDMPLVFQVVDGKHVLPQLHRGRIADISYCGMMAVLKEPVPASTEIKFSVALSLLSPEVTDIYARILRVPGSSEEYECNLEFTCIDAYGQRAVQQLVDRAVS